MTPWPPITRDDLRVAATSAGFDSVFPVLIRRLIAETADGLISLDMPGESGTAAGGFDGVVTTSRASAFVPGGTSVWELSVGGGQAKAEEDYSKRLDAPGGLPTHEVAYVEVLLVPWTKARAWMTEKTNDRRWREVLGYNLDRIHAWLDQAPATTVWLAGQLGKALPGVRSLGAWWMDTWLPSTQVCLDESIVLAGREKAADDLVAELRTGRSVVTLGGGLPPDEASAFVAAALKQAESLDASSMGARALFVSDATSLAQLIAQPQPMILLLSDAALARDLPAQHAHQLIVSAAPGARADVDVPRLNSQVIESQLKTTGIPHDQASRLGALGRRSLLALRRALAHNPDLLIPLWAKAPDALMRRLLLLGAWRNGNPEDRRVVAGFTGQPYERVEEEARRLAHVADVPFMGLVDDIWHVLSTEDTWTLLSASITADDLELFRTVVMEVLTELDPVLDMEPAERWKAGLRGVGRRFSHTLRRGLAESLALLGATDSIIQGTKGDTTAQFARLVVRELLDQANTDASYRLWLSLIDILGLLAEAAPEEFLDAMWPGLSGTPPAHGAMFTDSQDDGFGLGTSSPHSYFLWALESLAWSPDYLDDAVDVLAALAAVDPGGRLSNRPLASLLGILSAWCPNTTACLDDRIRCIRRIAKRDHAVGRQLLLELIPDGHVQTIHPGPQFRDWKREPSVTRAKFRQVVSTVVELLIEMLGDDLDLYLRLIEKIDDIPPEHRSVIAAKLKELGQTRTDADKAKAFYALREKIAHNREYSDAAWALPESQLNELQDACSSLAPKDPALRHAWLFQADWITLGDMKRRDDFTAYEKEVLSRRGAAVGEILAHGGIDALVELAHQTPYPHLIGTALAAYSGNYDNQMLAALTLGEAPSSDIAAGYFNRRLRQTGTELRDHLLAATDDTLTQARILRFTGKPSEARAKLRELEPAVAEHYWREFVYYGLGSDFPHAHEAAWALLDAGRPAAALDLLLLYMRRDDNRAEAAEIAASGLEALLDRGPNDPEFSILDGHQFERLFALLSEHSDELGHQRVVNLEWHFFPIIGLEADAPSLHRAIVEDPGFFVELVVSCFKPATSPQQEESDDLDELERKRAVAARAYDVLRTCQRCPGVTDNSQVDPAPLRSWVTSARTQLETVDRKEIGDLQIGALLAHSPAAVDGSPLHEAIRDLLEEIRSDKLERGIAISIHNSRGVVSRAVMDGGTQEWDLAMRYHVHAEAARDWPRTRKLFKRVAESYEVEARRNDAEAERRRQGLDW